MLSSWKFVSISITIIMDDCENKEFLPNLGNEMTSEQLELHTKVVQQNEKAIKIHSDIIKWFESLEHSQVYPAHVKMAYKSTYRRQLKKYHYDQATGILYKKITNSDSIGMYIICSCIFIHLCIMKKWKLFIFEFLQVPIHFIEQKVEIVMDIERQEKLIASCRQGVFDIM